MATLLEMVTAVFTKPQSVPQRRFVVEYSLPYKHSVQVGIEAESPEGAISTAEHLFNAGDLWDDTDNRPLLYDDYEEDDDGSALTFEVVAEVQGDWPVPAACVMDLRRREAAFAAVRAFIAAYRRAEQQGRRVEREEMDVVYALAQKAEAA